MTTLVKLHCERSAVSRMLRQIADDFEAGDCIAFSIEPEPNDVVRLSLRYVTGKIPEWPGIESDEVQID